MPHSIMPESPSADDSSQTMLQATTKSEPDAQDIAMEDAPSPAEVNKAKTNLEDLFDDEDSDQEFPSSAPIKSEEDLSQPKALYATSIC